MRIFKCISIEKYDFLASVCVWLKSDINAIIFLLNLYIIYLLLEWVMKKLKGLFVGSLCAVMLSIGIGCCVGLIRNEKTFAQAV